MSSRVSHRQSAITVLLLSMSSLSLMAGWAHAGKPWPSTGLVTDAAYQKIQTALDADTQVDFVDTPLEEVVNFLEDLHDIPIEIDSSALDDQGIGSDTPITASIRGVSLRSMLRIVLDQLDLTYAIQSEVLMITTPRRAALRPEIRVYNVSTLLGDDRDAGSLAATLYQSLQPDFAAGTGGPGGMPGAMGGMGGTAGGGFFAVQDEGFGYDGAAAPGTEFGGSSMGPTSHPARAIPVPRIIPFRQLLIVRHTTIGQQDVANLLGAMAAAIKADGQ
jgi:hypothetical protein